MTELVTSTRIDFTDEFPDFDTAWAHVAATVKEFTDRHPGCRVKVDDSSGRGIWIIVTPSLRGRINGDRSGP